MYIEELGKGEEVEKVETYVGEDAGTMIGCANEEVLTGGGSIVVLDAKRVLIGAGARALFYPTLLYNVLRNKIQTEFRWWDRVDEFILLGAVPFPADVPRLKELGVQGVITLNESYETLVPSYLYRSHGINHLVIPTRDYCFAPSMADICQAVDFIGSNASLGGTTYVHCKAGRGRSTTIVMCYLMQHKQMTPHSAYEYLRSIRPRVLLASSQWQAVQDYYHLRVKKNGIDSSSSMTTTLVTKTLNSTPPSNDFMRFDDGSVVVITRADIEGYDSRLESGGALKSEICTDSSVVNRVKEAALGRISCLWIRCHAQQKMADEKLKVGLESMRADSLGSITVDIHVY